MSSILYLFEAIERVGSDMKEKKWREGVICEFAEIQDICKKKGFKSEKYRPFCTIKLPFTFQAFYYVSLALK